MVKFWTQDVWCLAIVAACAATRVFGASWIEPPAATSAASPAPVLAGCASDWLGRVVEMQGHRRTPAVTVWLSNGVCVHHMKKELPPGQVVATVNLIGSELLESAESRGISMAAAEVWRRRSIEGVSAEELAGVIGDRDIHIEAAATADALQLRVWGSREDMEVGMRVMAGLLSRPRADAGAVEAAANEAQRLRRARDGTEQGLLRTAVAAAILPSEQSDPRMGLPDPERVRALKPESVQKWLDWHIETAPVEAAIVGDLSLEQAMKLAAGFLGQLPNRDRISSRTLAESRKLVPPPLPVSLRPPVKTGSGSSLVVVGFLGGDAARPTELRALRAAARLLNVRAQADLANSGVEHTGVGASVVPAVAYPGFGAVLLSARVARADEDRAADSMAATIRAAVDTGVDKDPRLDVVRTELAAVVKGFEQDQRYWSAILSRSVTQGTDPDDVADGETFYRGLEDAAITAALRRNAGPERMFRVVIGG